MVTFRIKPHSVTPGTEVVEILVDNEVVGVLYPMGRKGVRLVSAHMAGPKAEKEFAGVKVERDFAGEVLLDAGRGNFPPIPAILVEFRPSPYTIIGNRIVRIKR